MESRKKEETMCKSTFNDNEAILSAKELIDIYNLSLDKKPNYGLRKTAPINIDADTGSKLNNPTGSFLEINRTQTRLRNLFQQVSIPKVAQKGQLSQAIWNNSLMKAKVTKSCGKYWNVMGHMQENNLYIYLEEALFLLECNSLELILDDISMSLQQAFQLLTSKKSDCSLESYLTYSKLARLGYKVLRHRKDATFTSCEAHGDENLLMNTKSNCDTMSTTYKQSKVLSHKNNKNESTKVCKDLVIQLIQSVHDNSRVQTHLTHQTPNIKTQTSNEVPERKHIDLTENSISALKYTFKESNILKDLKDDDEISVLSDSEIRRLEGFAMLPNCYNRKRVTLTVPPLELLPNRAWPKKKVYIIDIIRPQLLKLSLSNMQSEKNDSALKETSLAIIDDDVEIIDVVPNKSSEVSLTNFKVQHSDRLEKASKNTSTIKKQSAKTTSTDSVIISNIRRETAEAYSPDTSKRKSAQGSSESRKVIDNPADNNSSAHRSRGYYPDQSAFLSLGLSNVSTNGKRKLQDVDGEDKNHSKKLSRQDVEIDLGFHPNKRLPVSNPKQCLPCDAATLKWLSQRDQTSYSSNQEQTSNNCNNMNISDSYDNVALAEDTPEIVNNQRADKSSDRKCRDYDMTNFKLHLNEEKVPNGSAENIENVVFPDKSSAGKTFCTQKCDRKNEVSNIQLIETTTVELTDELVIDVVPEERNYDNFIDLGSSSDSDVDFDDGRKLSSSLTEGPLSKLWGGQTKPLLKPADATSTAKIMAKLNLKMDKQKSCSSESIISKNNDCVTNCPFDITYDVYLPKTSYRKSTKCSPNYRITVCKPTDRLPTHNDVKLLTEQYGDSVPLLFSVCSLSSVAFYCFSKVTIPQMISLG